MNYSFDCQKHGTVILTLPVSECESTPPCERCGKPMQRNFASDFATVQISGVGSRDHNKIPHNKRTRSRHTVGTGAKAEDAYAADIHKKRELAAASGKRSRMSHSIPTELYHGKIRETGDKTYWKDEKNLARHKEWAI